MIPFRFMWERYFIWELLKTFALLIVSFYGLYVLIDYSSHTAHFHHHHIRPSWIQLIVYYASEFTRRMDVLIPFALLIATIRTLCLFNIHNELVALMASGVSSRRLMLPFLLVGFFFTGVIYMNHQYILPNGLKVIKAVGEQYAKQRKKDEQQPMAKHFLLADRSTVLYQDYDDVLMEFNDVYWIKSVDEIYHIRHLDASGELPVGFGVDHIVRDHNGHLTLKENFTKQTFSEITIDRKQLSDTITPAEDLSLGMLWQQMANAESQNSEKESQIITAFYQKLAMPWLCLLAIIGPAPLCMRFTRSLHVFFIYAISIFCLVGLYLVMDAAAVLGKRQVLWPAVAIWTPFTLFLGTLSWRFWNRLDAV